MKTLTFLKVKIKSLAEEAKIIRREEQKSLKQYHYNTRNLTNEDKSKSPASMEEGNYGPIWKSWSKYNELRCHRKTPVGTESRSTLIAYGYLRGKAYHEIEQPRSYKPMTNQNYTGTVMYNEPDWQRITEIVIKYGKGYVRDHKFIPQEEKDNIRKEISNWIAESRTQLKAA